MFCLNVKGAWAYSQAWMLVNSMPSRIVMMRPLTRPLRSPWISEWCAQVTVVPEQSRMSVLRSGKPNGFSTSMPLGGQTPPIASTAEGKSDESNHAQNQATKHITYDRINWIMP